MTQQGGVEESAPPTVWRKIKMNDSVINAERVSTSDRVPFKCTGCGKCCKHVRQSVPVESLDMYRIAKHLRSIGLQFDGIEELINRFMELALLDECGYFVLMLKVAGPKDACIFLTDDNRCSIHEANPRACRMYPFVADPSEGDGFRYLVSREYLHHFKGPGVHVRNWLKRYFIVEDREFLRADMGAAREIAALLRQIPETEKATALLHFMRCKYTEYDLDRPFMEQYLRNNEKLLTILRRMADNRKGSQDYE